MRSLAILGIGLSFLSGGALSSPTPRPAALEKLEPLLGTWAGEGIYRLTPTLSHSMGKHLSGSIGPKTGSS